MINLVLTYDWYDAIKLANKRTEFRANSPYWRSRLLHLRAGDKIAFKRGYSNKFKKIFAKVKAVRVIDNKQLAEESVEASEFLRCFNISNTYIAIDFDLL